MMETSVLTVKHCEFMTPCGWDCLPNWKGAADLWLARMREHEKP